MHGLMAMLAKVMNVKPIDCDVQVHGNMTLEELEEVLSKVNPVPAVLFKVMNESLDKIHASFNDRNRVIDELSEKVAKLQDDRYMADFHEEFVRLGEEGDAAFK